MAKGIVTPVELRREIIAKIRDQGMPVAKAAAEYNVSVKVIYNWMRDGVLNSSSSLILENNRLKKENDQLYRLLGRATAEMHKSKN
jgi:transposase